MLRKYTVLLYMEHIYAPRTTNVIYRIYLCALVYNPGSLNNWAKNLHSNISALDLCKNLEDFL